MSGEGELLGRDERRSWWAAAAMLLGAAAMAALLAGCPGCAERCSEAGCPPDLACSLATERCMDPSMIYGPPCPLGPSQCHNGVCLELPSDEGGPICTGTCEPGDPPCPDGFSCLPVSDGLGGTARVCVPRGAGEIGDPCESDTDCATSICLRVDPRPFCSEFCGDDPLICGEGNVACLTFTDTQDNHWDLCVKGGDSGPGEGCPAGMLDCDLTSTDICLASEDNSINFCSVGCPDGVAACEVFPGGCCVDLGEADDPDDFFCLPREYCPCVPQCLGRECGPDGCGGLCGVCDDGFVCRDGSCVECIPDCGDAECGPDGCGGLCGTCETGAQCVDGQCVGSCTPSCEEAECGPDGCGGLCGACVEPLRCHEGACVEPALLLVDVLVLDPALEPRALWGLGEYRGPPSIGPWLDYGQGPQPNTTQVELCGETVSCNEQWELASGVTYSLRMGYVEEGELARCVATFHMDESQVLVDGGDCVLEGGGPFESIWVEGSLEEAALGWALP